MRTAIQSRDNERVKHARALASKADLRAEEGLFFAEGLRLCLDLGKTHAVHSVFATEELLCRCPEAEALADEVFVVSKPVAQKLAGTKTPQGLFCLFHLPAARFEDLRLRDGVLVCEAVQDPANVGAMLRSAAGLGFGGAVLLDGCADPYAEKALRASMGAVGRIPLLWGHAAKDALSGLQEAGVYLVAAALDAQAVPCAEMNAKPPFALLIGNEGAGLSEKALAAADETVYIPMQNGVESLNAAAAAAVLMAAAKAVF